MKPLRPAKPTFNKKKYIKDMHDHGVGKKRAKDSLRDAVKGNWYMNDIYTVIVRRGKDLPKDMNPTGMSNLIWISFRRNDRRTITDWRHKQEIKNQILGKECEACELYPAESRLNDMANQYHMFGFDIPELTFPFGFNSRQVGERTFGNSAQRKFEEKS